MLPPRFTEFHTLSGSICASQGIFKLLHPGRTWRELLTRLTGTLGLAVPPSMPPLSWKPDTHMSSSFPSDTQSDRRYRPDSSRRDPPPARALSAPCRDPVVDPPSWVSRLQLSCTSIHPPDWRQRSLVNAQSHQVTVLLNNFPRSTVLQGTECSGFCRPPHRHAQEMAHTTRPSVVGFTMHVGFLSIPNTFLPPPTHVPSNLTGCPGLKLFPSLRCRQSQKPGVIRPPAPMPCCPAGTAGPGRLQAVQGPMQLYKNSHLQAWEIQLPGPHPCLTAPTHLQGGARGLNVNRTCPGCSDARPKSQLARRGTTSLLLTPPGPLQISTAHSTTLPCTGLQTPSSAPGDVRPSHPLSTLKQRQLYKNATGPGLTSALSR